MLSAIAITFDSFGSCDGVNTIFVSVSPLQIYATSPSLFRYSDSSEISCLSLWFLMRNVLWNMEIHSLLVQLRFMMNRYISTWLHVHMVLLIFRQN